MADSNKGMMGGGKPGVQKATLQSLIDILAILGVFILSAVALGVVLGLLVRSGSVSKEFGMFMSYVLNVGATIVFAWWLYRQRESANPPLVFSFRKANPILTLWGVVFIAAVSIALEPMLALFPSEWMDVMKNYIGNGKSIWIALSLIVAAPLLEEILFRGIVQGISVRSFGALKGILLSALVFGVAHVNVPQQAVNAFVVGLILGFVYYRTGSLASSIVLHMANNLIAYLFLLAGRQDAMLRDLITNNTVYWVIYSACVLIAVYSFVKFYNEIKRTETGRKLQQ